MATLTAQQLIDRLKLEALDGEGGFYRRIYEDPCAIQTDTLGPFSSLNLPLSSAIYYLMTRESFSALHWLAGLEIWTWIAGDPIEQVVAHPSGTVERRLVGLCEKMVPVSIVPGDCWQGSRVHAEGSVGYALCSTVMCPAYDQRDFKLADSQVCERYAAHAEYMKEFLAYR